jgi:hypothetical protein
MRDEVFANGRFIGLLAVQQHGPRGRRRERTSELT